MNQVRRKLAGFLYANADPASSSNHRTDIQALRALAVGAVVVNHIWPSRLTGGYVGVDVFFVISGFLITTHLLKEQRSTNRISLKQFYARRIRRLLPAALLVLAVAAVGARLFFPFSRWQRNGLEIASSAFYIENWFLAARSVNYSALNDAASVSQHYWSLSVEEQFYLLWPLFLIGLWQLIKRRQDHETRVGLIGMGLVITASLAFSIWYTATHPAPAYFATPTRFWEFALGGALAFLNRGARQEAPGRFQSVIAQVAAVLGFAMIIWAAASYTSTTSFPGFMALVPTVGTALVIQAGSVLPRPWHGLVTSLRPIHYLGDISYSVYLWHWPVVILAPFALGHTLGFWDKLLVAVLGLFLAGLTKKFVEDPCRRWPWLQAKARRTYLSMIIGMLVVGMISLGLVWNQRHVEHSLPTGVPNPADICAGPNALHHLDSCPNAFGPAAHPVMTEEINAYYAEPTDPHCTPITRAAGYGTMCDFSDGPDSAQVLLFGDSHAQQWQYAIIPLAKQRHWKLLMSYAGGCPTADVEFTGYRDAIATADQIAGCVAWRNTEREQALIDGTDVVFISFFAREERVDDGSGRDAIAQYTSGLNSYVAPLISAGIDVYVLGDPPLNSSVRDPNCAIFHAGNPVACALARDIAQPPDPLIEAANASGGTITGIDLTDSFCDDTNCYIVVGGVPVYFDLDHLNRQYVALLSPLIADYVH